MFLRNIPFAPVLQILRTDQSFKIRFIWIGFEVGTMPTQSEGPLFDEDLYTPISFWIR